MLIMDASTRDQCEVTRSRTNTPLQALVLMNDPQILEAARILSERTSTLNITEEEKLKKSFRKIVCRTPTVNELKMLVEYYNKEKKKFGSNPESALKYLQAGEYTKAQNKNPASTAALMEINQMLFNLDETTIK